VAGDHGDALQRSRRADKQRILVTHVQGRIFYGGVRLIGFSKHGFHACTQLSGSCLGHNLALDRVQRAVDPPFDAAAKNLL
jgi:hypothetical protein